MTVANHNEKTVIVSILDGDVNAYEQLVERYHRGLINYLYNLLGDGDAAEDVAQEAFIAAYQKLDLYNPDYAFSTWLYAIAQNLAFKQLKVAKRTTSLEPIEELLTDEDSVSTADKLDGEQTKESVRVAIQKLPPHFQQVIALYYWDNRSYEEIADIMQHPIGTIRTWLHRAKELLRKELYGQAR